MDPRVRSIRIEAFRGIPTLEIPLEGKSLLLKGENGTGKSSIVEAFEFFFRGGVSHLEGTQGISLKRHGHHVHFKPDDMKVEMTFGPGNVTLQRTLKSAPPCPPELASILNSARNGTYILRRSQILEYIESDPVKRFAAIESIMGVSTLDEIELGFKAARDKFQGEFETREQLLRRSYERIEEVIGEQITNLGEALPAMSRKAESLNLPPLTSLDDIPSYAKRIYATLRRKSEKAPIATALRKVTGIFDKPIFPDEFLTRISLFATKVNSLVSQGAVSELKGLEFLELGEGFIIDSTAQKCPLCGQGIVRGKLLQEISERKKLLVQLSDEASGIRREAIALEGETQSLIARLNSARELAQQTTGLSRFAERLTRERKFFEAFLAAIVTSKEFEVRFDISLLPGHQARMVKIAVAMTKASDELLERAELTEEESKMVEFFQLLGSFREEVKEISDLERDLKVRRQKSEVAQALYSTFSESKRLRVQAAYDAIQGTIQKYYSSLHPSEAPRTIRLQVYPGRRASTKISVDSFNLIGEDPRALESEGHLDSLGICIFLAFVKAFSSDCPLIILDDVVTTIDAGHRQRLAELLFEEFSGKQLMVTTHDEIWFEQFVLLEKTYRVENDFINKEIVGWDINNGPRIRNYRPRWESIEERINAGDKRPAGNESRQYLEWILENECLALKVPIELRIPPRYEVGDYLPPLRKRIESLFEEGDPKRMIMSAFDDLGKTSMMGNLLSHNNIFAPNVSITEVKRFADTIRALHLSFSCQSCGSLLTYSREFKVIRCSSPRCADPMEFKAR